jgi:hypothetical protein
MIFKRLKQFLDNQREGWKMIKEDWNKGYGNE